MSTFFCKPWRNIDERQLRHKSIIFTLYTDLLYMKYNDEEKQDEDFSLCKLSRDIEFDRVDYSQRII